MYQYICVYVYMYVQSFLWAVDIQMLGEITFFFFCEILRFVTTITRSNHLTPPWVGWILFRTYFAKNSFQISLPSVDVAGHEATVSINDRVTSANLLDCSHAWSRSITLVQKTDRLEKNSLSSLSHRSHPKTSNNTFRTDTLAKQSPRPNI